MALRARLKAVEVFLLSPSRGHSAKRARPAPPPSIAAPRILIAVAVRSHAVCLSQTGVRSHAAPLPSVHKQPDGVRSTSLSQKGSDPSGVQCAISRKGGSQRRRCNNPEWVRSHARAVCVASAGISQHGGEIPVAIPPAPHLLGAILPAADWRPFRFPLPPHPTHTYTHTRARKALVRVDKAF